MWQDQRNAREREREEGWKRGQKEGDRKGGRIGRDGRDKERERKDVLYRHASKEQEMK